MFGAEGGDPDKSSDVLTLVSVSVSISIKVLLLAPHSDS